jgi:hypothetical protein
MKHQVFFNADHQEKPVMHRLLMNKVALVAGLLLLGAVGTTAAKGQQSNEELAKQAQNPVADLISVPFQNNTNFNVGPLEKNQNVLNIQPVIPIHLNADWNLITRTILPVISQPEFIPGEGRTNGLGNTQFTAFLSSARTGELIWGIGPIVQLPTNTNKLGSDKWGLGPSAVALRIDGPWLYGALVNNVWSIAFAGPNGPDAPPYNQFLLQPFINYNFPDGLYLSAAPIITANWKAEQSKNVWTVPLGGGVGKLWRIDRLPVNTQMQAFYNVEKPEFGADWTLRLQLQFLFPK